ncbi:hypothetical protein GALMADRAFT_148684 [Galerina marginata CBS 339.88]|uniref:Uncharacterized protein n=1 Tax=Galerina marginata (strain CBS 339.88) TaxID=685588 RepID=A0A067SFD6_GALM3|nr:hypothetical protein GALMADRAFT_148684 [Galerina marginata CBS 339.88]
MEGSDNEGDNEGDTNGGGDSGGHSRWGGEGGHAVHYNDMEVDGDGSGSDEEDDDEDDETPKPPRVMETRRLYRRSDTSADDAFFAQSSLNTFNSNLIRERNGEMPDESASSGSNFSETRRLAKTQRTRLESDSEDDDDSALAGEVVASSPACRPTLRPLAEANEDPNADFVPSGAASRQHLRSGEDLTKGERFVSDVMDDGTGMLEEMEPEEDVPKGKNKGGRPNKKYNEICKSLGERVRQAIKNIAAEYNLSENHVRQKSGLVFGSRGGIGGENRWNLIQQYLSLRHPEIVGRDEFLKFAKAEWEIFQALSPEEQDAEVLKMRESLLKLTHDTFALKSAVRRVINSKQDVQKLVEFISEWNPDIHYIVADFYTGNDPAARQHCSVIASSELGKKILQDNPIPVGTIVDGLTNKFRSVAVDRKYDAFMKEGQKNKKTSKAQAEAQPILPVQAGKEVVPTEKLAPAVLRSEVTNFFRGRLAILAPGGVGNNVRWAKLTTLAKTYEFCINGWPSSVVSSLPHLGMFASNQPGPVWRALANSIRLEALTIDRWSDDAKAVPKDSVEYQYIPLITNSNGKALVEIKDLPPPNTASTNTKLSISSRPAISAPPAQPRFSPPSSPVHAESPVNHPSHQSLGSPIRMRTRETTTSTFFASPGGPEYHSFSNSDLAEDYHKALANLNAQFKQQSKKKHQSDLFKGYRVVDPSQATHELYSYTSPEIVIQRSAPVASSKPAPSLSSKSATFPYRPEIGRNASRKFAPYKVPSKMISPSSVLNQSKGAPSTRSLLSAIPADHPSKHIFLKDGPYTKTSSESASHPPSSRHVHWGKTAVREDPNDEEEEQGPSKKNSRYDRKRRYHEVAEGVAGPSYEVFKT